MLKKPVAVILLLAAVVIAAFVGGYMATRVKVEPVDDLVVTVPDAPADADEDSAEPGQASAGGATGRRPGGGGARPAGRTSTAGGPQAPTTGPSAGAPTESSAALTSGGGAAAGAGNAAAPAPPVAQERPKELTVPAGQIITIRLNTPISSERNKVEDPVEAFLTKDVLVGPHVALPAGARVLGSISVAEKGGGFNKPARIGVRFHTLVLANGREARLSIDPIVAEAESNAGGTKKKVTWGAALGAGLGYVTGGVDGAVKGGMAGAGGGTAAAAVSKGQGAEVARGQTAPLMLSAPVTIASD